MGIVNLRWKNVPVFAAKIMFQMDNPRYFSSIHRLHRIDDTDHIFSLTSLTETSKMEEKDEEKKLVANSAHFTHDILSQCVYLFKWLSQKKTLLDTIYTHTRSMDGWFITVYLHRNIYGFDDNE